MTKSSTPLFLVIDLFCGAGGTTTGFVQAMNKGRELARVIACVNHDPKAIKSHWANHPEVKHFEEDIRTLDLTELIEVVRFQRSLYPDAAVILWASLECTNFSKAKGGQPREADSRTLADHLHRYVDAISPDYIQIENVVEFMSWGPLDENGKPVSRKNGCDWLRWRREMCDHGYSDEWRELNSADFGAYTSRNRLFGIFAKPGMPVCWPEPTHSKKPGKGMFDGLKKWMPVKDVLNFEDEGESILTRKKPLSDKTLERILAGLQKYVAKGDTSFITKYYSGKPSGKNIPTDGPAGTIKTIDGQAIVNTIPFIVQRNNGTPGSKVLSVDGPARTITGTGGNQDLVQANFLIQTYAANSKGDNTFPVDKPARTVTTRDATQIVQPKFLMHFYSGGGQHSSVFSPCPTIPCRDNSSFVSAEFLVNYNHRSTVNDVNNPSPTITAADKLAIAKPMYFIDQHYGNHGNPQNQSIHQPAGSVMPNDKHRLVEAVPFLMPTNYENTPKSVEEPAPTINASRRHHYLVNPSHGGHVTSTESPCPVIVARQDKAPLYLVLTEGGQVAVEIYDTDSEPMIRIKQFMSHYGLVDIKMRMLRVPELLKIQGFPENYKLEGNQSDQKKFIGNSVVPLIVKVWTEALGTRLIQNSMSKIKVA